MQDTPAQMSELYSAYAAGRLSAPYALLVETQMAIRPDVRADVACAESLSGIFLEQDEGEPLAPNAYERTLQAIDRLGEDEDNRRQAAQMASEQLTELMDLPEPLREKALEACVGKGWKRMTSGVSRLDIATPGGHAHLYRIKPGASVPRHTHEGDELTLVVRGGFSDETGSFGPGDIALQTSNDTHQPLADTHGVCLALAVSDGGMKFKGMLGLVQKLFG